MGKLERKVAIVTGASGGLGRQTALRFATEGAMLSICARTESKLQETVKECEKAGAEVIAMPVDVSNYDDLGKFVQVTINRFGTIDILVNNAATILDAHPFVEHTRAELDASLQSGLYAAWELMQLCYPYLKGKSSSIINFGSGAGIQGLEGYAAYAATKEAIRALSRVVAREWGKDGIRVNAICPNAVTAKVKAGIEQLPPEQREQMKSALSQNPFGRSGDPYEDITPVVVFLACDDSRWITGQSINADGGGDIHS